MKVKEIQKRVRYHSPYARSKREYYSKGHTKLRARERTDNAIGQSLVTVGIQFPSNLLSAQAPDGRNLDRRPSIADRGRSMLNTEGLHYLSLPVITFASQHNRILPNRDVDGGRSLRRMQIGLRLRQGIEAPRLLPSLPRLRLLRRQWQSLPHLRLLRRQ